MQDPLHWLSVRTKLALMFLSVCLLAFGVGGWLVSASARGALEREILARLDLQAQAWSRALDAELGVLRRRAEDFASDGYIRERAEALQSDPPDSGALRGALRRHLAVNKLPLVAAYEDLTILSAARGVLASARRDPGAAEIELLRPSLERDEAVLGGLLPALEPDGPPRLALCVPLRGVQGGARLGTLVAWVHPGVWIIGALHAIAPAPGEPRSEVGLRLIDPAGRELRVLPSMVQAGGPSADSDLVRSGFGLEIVEPALAAKGREAGSAPSQWILQRAFPIAGTLWRAQVDLYAEHALSAVSGLQSRFLGVGAALAILVSLLLFFPMRFLARPLARLAEAAGRIQGGDFSVRVEVESGDEVGALAHSFNHMAEAVEERTHALELTARDLREGQQALRLERDRLRTVISSMRDGLVVLAPDGRALLSNHAAGPLLRLLEGLTPHGAGRQVCELGSRASRECRACLLDTSAPPRSCLVEVGGGAYEIHAAPLAPDQGGQTGRLLISRDVSDRIAQDERQIHQERLAVLGEVAAVMAHELNNPLAAISMYNQMLRSEVPAASPLLESIDVIQRNSEACKRTIRELLDYATDAMPEIGPVDVHATLEDVAEFLRPLRQRRHVELALDLCPGDPLLTGDEFQVRQIFVNLIVNAIQAQAVPGTVRVRTSVADGHVLIDVEDQGCGIPPEARERIFKPFYTTKARGEGTGLGLSTARRIAEMHGGSLELIESRPGRTVFRVCLRRRLPENSAKGA